MASLSLAALPFARHSREGGNLWLGLSLVVLLLLVIPAQAGIYGWVVLVVLPLFVIPAQAGIHG